MVHKMGHYKHSGGTNKLSLLAVEKYVQTGCSRSACKSILRKAISACSSEKKMEIVI